MMNLMLYFAKVLSILGILCFLYVIYYTKVKGERQREIAKSSPK